MNKSDVQNNFETVFSGKYPDTKAMAMRICFDFQPHVVAIICKNFKEFFNDGMMETLSKMVITKE